jgi:hypothetical protein
MCCSCSLFLLKYVLRKCDYPKSISTPNKIKNRRPLFHVRRSERSHVHQRFEQRSALFFFDLRLGFYPRPTSKIMILLPLPHNHCVLILKVPTMVHNQFESNPGAQPSQAHSKKTRSHLGGDYQTSDHSSDAEQQSQACSQRTCTSQLSASSHGTERSQLGVEFSHPSTRSFVVEANPTTTIQETNAFARSLARS